MKLYVVLEFWPTMDPSGQIRACVIARSIHTSENRAVKDAELHRGAINKNHTVTVQPVYLDDLFAFGIDHQMNSGEQHHET